MTILILLLAAYGLCYGLMNKALFLHRVPFLERLLECHYCTGCHCGWITWLAGWAIVGPLWLVGWGTITPWDGGPPWVGVLASLVMWVFGVGGWCYLLDTAARRFEGGSTDEP